jgi:hypothetical protein
VVVRFGKTVLADLEEGIFCDRIIFDAQSIVDVQDYPDALDVEIFARGNISKRIGFTAEREHEDENVAELFQATHDEDILGKNDTLFIGGSFGGWERFYKMAACTRCSTTSEGCRTYTTYEFVAGVAAKKQN